LDPIGISGGRFSCSANVLEVDPIDNTWYTSDLGRIGCFPNFSLMTTTSNIGYHKTGNAKLEFVGILTSSIFII